MGLYVVPGEGTVAVFRQRLETCLFSGVLFAWPLELLEVRDEGTIMDEFGVSAVRHLNVANPDRLTFRKQYLSRRDTIDYDLTKQPDGSWQGVWLGDAVGRGSVRCFITPVEENFLLEPSLDEPT
ncbi:MAG: hypothetical protein AAB590_03250 [Patescibacteria group bacterium]